MLSANSTRISTSFLLCFSALLFSCENDEKAVNALSEKHISVDEGIDIETLFSSNGKVKAKLTSPLMKHYQTDSAYFEFPKTLHVDFYNDSTLQVESQLNARYGKYRANENKVFLKDSVVVFNISGDTLHSQELWWDERKKLFYTDKPARIYRGDGTVIFGKQGLTAAQDFSEVTIHQASGVVPRPKDEEF